MSGPVDVTTAQQLLLSQTRCTEPETLAVEHALGRVPYQELHSPYPLPRWPVARMDGYAVHPKGDTSFSYQCVGESAAGHPFEHPLEAGQCVRISTGAVLPQGSFAVVPQEDTTRVEDTVTLSKEGQDQLAPQRYIRAVGSDLPEQSLLACPGQPLDMGALALVAATGHGTIDVHGKPRVALLSTGSELVPVGQRPKVGQIVATNTMTLRWQCEAAGARVTQECWVRDDHSSTRAAIERLAPHCDLLLTCGGISVGPHDHILPSLQELGFRQAFRKVKLAPGRPTTGGVLGSTLVLALPGNPASCYVTFELFVRPILNKMLGKRKAHWFRPRRLVQCQGQTRPEHTRDRYIRAVVSGSQARLYDQQNSGDLSSLWGHNALVRVPAQSPPDKRDFWALLLSERDFEEPSSA